MALILTGGFLGSGKTTAIVNAGKLLKDARKQFAVITNDQGNQQVDNAFIKSFGFRTEQVENGCFCCKFNELSEYLEKLNTGALDFVFAESVGSCTDLVATVVKPLEQTLVLHKIIVNIFVDVTMISAVIEQKSAFEDESVRYIFKKQLEEADVIILNKCDKVSISSLETVKQFIRQEYPGITMLAQDSNNPDHISKWIEFNSSFKSPDKRQSLSIDYDTYAAGEEKMAWLDKKISVHSKFGDSINIARDIIQTIFSNIQRDQLIIGHLKFFIDTKPWKYKISLTTSSTGVNFKIPDWHENTCSLLINARVLTNPELLLNIVNEAIKNSAQKFHCEVESHQTACFKPGIPKPMHRIN